MFYSSDEPCNSAKNQGIHRTGITSVAYLPNTFIYTNDEAQTLVERQVNRVKRDRDLYPPGLHEQYQLQLEALENDAIPDLEILAFPGFYSATCTLL